MVKTYQNNLIQVKTTLAMLHANNTAEGSEVIKMSKFVVALGVHYH